MLVTVALLAGIEVFLKFLPFRVQYIGGGIAVVVPQQLLLACRYRRPANVQGDSAAQAAPSEPISRPWQAARRFPCATRPPTAERCVPPWRCCPGRR